MYCRWCGKEIPDDSIYCPRCGRKVSEPSDEDKDEDKSLSVQSDDANETDGRETSTEKIEKKISENIESFYDKNEKQMLRMSWLLPLLALALAFLGIVPLNIFDIVILIIGLVMCLVAIFVLVILITHLVTKKTKDGMYHAIFGGILTCVDIVLLSSFLSACVEFYSCAAGC